MSGCDPAPSARLLGHADFLTLPWRNGGGVTLDLAWDSESEPPNWRLSRTTIARAGPFSDYSGHDRHQTVLAGQGLVLEGPNGAIDLRRPFRLAAYPGEWPIVARLEDGPVEVFNLIVARGWGRGELTWLCTQDEFALREGLHFACPIGGQVRLRLGDGPARTVPDRQVLAIRARDPSVLARAAADAGLVVASLFRPSRLPSADAA